MSGTEPEPAAEALDRLQAVLDRTVPIAPLDELRRSLDRRPAPQAVLGQIAFGFDSSVFMRLAVHRRSADILDYLPRHEAPLIIPGQAIQEFWNNHFKVIDTVATSLKKRFEQLAQDVHKLDPEFGDFEAQMQSLLDRFQESYGHVYDENTLKNVGGMLTILQERATCPFAPRVRFSKLVAIRHTTKTPPGFKDPGDGDFFIWVDFLFGLLVSVLEGEKTFRSIVLLTNDQKPDWSTGGVPHPVLSAEVGALFGVPFDVWDLERFATEVVRALETPSDDAARDVEEQRIDASPPAAEPG
ncbi:hypothetical protein [Jiangella alkaliphila]|uniref:Uncharacterized protein n=1 Tax=Jiangella alkaliphila TaxID=419479 RepID=A0A1H2IVP5_9ACTN|nr:hypothetical protein [Jiangella alkaliphila]SDU48213.1 hypothetical protein SAMN04488563_2057 [Jiangella alkaliphila]